jgi:hypothetical protein
MERMKKRKMKRLAQNLSNLPYQPLSIIQPHFAGEIFFGNGPKNFYQIQVWMIRLHSNNSEDILF